MEEEERSRILLSLNDQLRSLSRKEKKMTGKRMLQVEHLLFWQNYY